LGTLGSFACFGVARESAASKSANARSTVIVRAALSITARVYGGLGLGALGNDVRNAKCDLHQIVHRDKSK